MYRSGDAHVLKGGTLGNEHEYFTRREYETFKGVLFGLTTKQIAKQLAISPRTVEVYIESIKRKLQCHSKYHIAEAAMRLGIVQQNILKNSSLQRNNA